MRPRRLLLLGALVLAVGAGWWWARSRPCVTADEVSSRAPVAPAASAASPSPASVPRAIAGRPPRPAGRSATVQLAALATLAALERGAAIALPLPGGEERTGRVNLAVVDAGVVRLGGELVGAPAGSFALAVQASGIAGIVQFPSLRMAVEISPAAGGRHLVQEKPLGDLLCLTSPVPPGEAPGTPAGGPVAAPPLLSSRPTATAVLYLDFDGETVVDPHWNSGNPIVADAPSLTEAQIIETWARLKEDFMPFDLDVTTDLARYRGAPANRRARCIVTPTRSWYPDSVGGVAFIGAFRLAGSTFSSNVPCWAFNSSPSTIAEVVSHEFGHVLGLTHDGTAAGVTYYTGHGAGAVSWGPIMGSTYSVSLSQWSKGEYLNANNTQDDIAIIADTSTNGFGFAADEAGNSRAAAAPLGATSNIIHQTGVIGSSADVDFFAFTLTGLSSFALDAAPPSLAPNLDIGLELHDASGNILLASNPDLQVTASLAASLGAGTYYLKVQGVGRGAPLGDGYSSYGSIGSYTLAGNFGTVTPPVIVNQPVAQTVVASSTLTLSVTAAGQGPLTYQWRKDNVALSGATASTLVLAAISAAQAGDYAVTVTNPAGSTSSAVARIAVLSLPVIVTPPQSVAVAFGQPATFSVAATGAGPLAYAWLRDGVTIVGATQATLTIASAQATDAGTYFAVVSNGVGPVTSPGATLTVNIPAPAIVTSPLSQTANLGSAVVLGVDAAGPLLAYQWRKKGNAIAGATGSVYSLAAVQTADAGSYDVVVSNPGGAVTSAAATLAVRLPPTIVTAPGATAVAAGSSASLAVIAGGSAPLAYQWSKDGAPLAGATAATLAIPVAQATDAGLYSVAISNAAGTIASPGVALHVFPSLPYATHLVTSAGYRAGGTVTVANTLAYSGAVSSLGWEVLIPTGWAFVSGAGSQGNIPPAAGATGFVEWAWSTVLPSPIAFTYTLSVPAAAAGEVQLVARAIVRPSGAPRVDLLARPDPLPVSRATYHAADTDYDFALGLLELTRVIELYNTRSGTVRTGAYRVDAANLEDGFSADSARLAAAALERHHSADTRGATSAAPADGRIDLFELTRVIELYNTRSGTVRTGRYRVQTGTEDGFAAAP